MAEPVEVATFREIGREIGVTPARARQIYNEAMWKIRAHLLKNSELGEAMGEHLDDEPQPGLRYPKTPEQSLPDVD